MVGDGIAVWSGKQQMPEDPESQRDFLSSVQHAVLSIGINTSGMIDALIQDAPVATIITDAYRATQEQAIHFQHMRSAGCLYELESVAELPQLIMQVKAGESDAMRQRRQTFVRSMIRPHGLEFSAGDLAVWCVERLGEGMPPTAVKVALAQLVGASRPAKKGHDPSG